MLARSTSFLFGVVAALVTTASVEADPGSTFTYQGELRASGAPVEGTRSMSVTLWDAITGGTQVAGPLDFPAVSISDGRFVLDLDFGVDALAGGARWLEVTVEGFMLTPRQPLRASPYSLQTRGIVVSEDGRVAIGTTEPLEDVNLVVEAGPDQGDVGLWAYSADGSAIIAVGDASFSPTVTVVNNAAAPALRATRANTIFADLAGPSYALRARTFDADAWAGQFEGRTRFEGSTYFDGPTFVNRQEAITGAEYFGVHAPVTAGFGGMYISTDAENTRPFYGYAPDGSAEAWTEYDGEANVWRVVIGGISRFEVGVGGPLPANAPENHVVSVAEDGTVLGGDRSVTVTFDSFDHGPVYIASVSGIALNAADHAYSVVPTSGAAVASSVEPLRDGRIAIRFWALDGSGQTVMTSFSLTIEEL